MEFFVVFMALHAPTALAPFALAESFLCDSPIVFFFPESLLHLECTMVSMQFLYGVNAGFLPLFRLSIPGLGMFPQIEKWVRYSGYDNWNRFNVI